MTIVETILVVVVVVVVVDFVVGVVVDFVVVVFAPGQGYDNVRPPCTTELDDLVPALLNVFF